MLKKTITALAVCGVFLVTAAPAQAAPKDPVRALKAKLVPGHGVRFTETAEWSDGIAAALTDLVSRRTTGKVFLRVT
ncbi:hypothetical protein ACWEPN_27885 [Nonomuraea wenchangensis]